MTRYQKRLWDNRHTFACQRQSQDVVVSYDLDSEKIHQSEESNEEEEDISRSPIQFNSEIITVRIPLIPSIPSILLTAESKEYSTSRYFQMLKRMENVYTGQKSEQWREYEIHD